jgi:hypothetical protein
MHEFLADGSPGAWGLQKKTAGKPAVPIQQELRDQLARRRRAMKPSAPRPASIIA